MKRWNRTLSMVLSLLPLLGCSQGKETPSQIFSSGNVASFPAASEAIRTGGGGEIQPFAQGFDRSAEAVQDFDGDSREDLPVRIRACGSEVCLETGLIRGTPERPSVLWSQWARQFFPVSLAEIRFVTGDFNGDSKTDVAAVYGDGTGHTETTIGVFYSEGNRFRYALEAVRMGGFAPRMRWFAGNFSRRGGPSDLAKCWSRGSGASRSLECDVHFSDRQFRYQRWTDGNRDLSLGAVTDDTRFIVTDFNGDGLKDIVRVIPQVVSGRTEARFQVYSTVRDANDRGARFSLSAVSSGFHGTMDSRMHFGAADLSGDGLPEIYKYWVDNGSFQPSYPAYTVRVDVHLNEAGRLTGFRRWVDVLAQQEDALIKVALGYFGRGPKADFFVALARYSAVVLPPDTPGALNTFDRSYAYLPVGPSPSGNGPDAVVFTALMGSTRSGFSSVGYFEASSPTQLRVTVSMAEEPSFGPFPGPTWRYSPTLNVPLAAAAPSTVAQWVPGIPFPARPRAVTVYQCQPDPQVHTVPHGPGSWRVYRIWGDALLTTSATECAAANYRVVGQFSAFEVTDDPRYQNVYSYYSIPQFELPGSGVGMEAAPATHFYSYSPVATSFYYVKRNRDGLYHNVQGSEPNYSFLPVDPFSSPPGVQLRHYRPQGPIFSLRRFVSPSTGGTAERRLCVLGAGIQGLTEFSIFSGTTRVAGPVYGRYFRAPSFSALPTDGPAFQRGTEDTSCVGRAPWTGRLYFTDRINGLLPLFPQVSGQPTPGLPEGYGPAE